MKSEDVVCRSLNLGEAGSILLFKHQTGAALVVLGELLQQPLRNIERQGRLVIWFGGGCVTSKTCQLEG